VNVRGCMRGKGRARKRDRMEDTGRATARDMWADRTNESKSVGNCGRREVQEHGTVINEETQEGVVGCQE